MKTRIDSGSLPQPSSPPPVDPLAFASTSTVYLISPYDDIPYRDRQQVTGYIPKSDHEFLFRDHCPAQGIRVKVISGLFFAFMRAFRAVRASHPDDNPYEQIVTLLKNISFEPKQP